MLRCPCSNPLSRSLDPVDLNFERSATFDDGSCANPQWGTRRQLQASGDEVSAPAVRELPPGCMDPTALNTDADAAVHDQDACVYGILGCRHPAALNYISAATHEAPAEDELRACIFPILGECSGVPTCASRLHLSGEWSC